jgi:hypothetical protein
LILYLISISFPSMLFFVFFTLPFFDTAFSIFLFNVFLRSPVSPASISFLFIQHCFIYRLSKSIVPEGVENEAQGLFQSLLREVRVVNQLLVTSHWLIYQATSDVPSLFLFLSLSLSLPLSQPLCLPLSLPLLLSIPLSLPCLCLYLCLCLFLCFCLCLCFCL